MSTYVLSPDGYIGSSWVNVAGSIPGGSLGDGSDSTAIKSVSPGFFYLTMGTKTIPANEVASGALVSVRGYKVSGSGSCTVRLFGGGVDGPLLAVPAGAGWASASGGAVSLLMSQANVDGIQLSLQAASSGVFAVSEATVQLLTSSLPQAPVVVSPSGTVTDSSRPVVAWTHMDRTQATVTNKARSGNVATITATNTFVAGQTVNVSIGDVQLDGQWVVASSSGSAFTYQTVVSGTIASAAASGTAWVGDDKPATTSEVAYFSAAQYGIAGFDPATSPANTRYTTSYGGTSSYQPPRDLTNGAYRAYVRTAVSIAGQTVWSPWNYSAFTVALVPQAAPDFSAVWDELSCSTVCTVAGHGNLLSANQANGTESGAATGWAASVNCSVTSSTTVAKSGTRSLRLSSTASGTMSATTPTGTSGIPVVEGLAFTALASFRAGASARAVHVDIAWWDAAGSTLGVASGASTNDATGSWTSRSNTATAPAGAAFASVVVVVNSTGGASELHYVDEVLFAPGTVAGWAPGGLSGWEVVVERSTDGEVTWTQVRTPTGAAGTVGVAVSGVQSLVLTDHEVPRGAAVSYRASIVATSPLAQASGYGEDAVDTTIDGLMWLKSLDDPALNTGFRLFADDWTESRDTRAESFPRASQQGTFVVRHPGSGRDPSVTITTESVEEHEALDALLLTGALLVQHVDVDSDGVGRQFAGVVTGSARYSPVAPGEGVWDVSFDLTVED